MSLPPEPSSASPSLRRTLGVVDGVAILIGITIGAGIFSTPRIIAGYQSSFYDILLLWLLAGAFVYIGGLIYAELGTRFPNTGGEYVYLHRAFGPYVGFIFGWAQLFIIRTSPAAGLALITADYARFFWPTMSQTAHTLLALLVIAVLGTLNYVGIRQASVYQKLSTMIKVGGLVGLVVVGLVLLPGQTDRLGETLPPTEHLGAWGNFSAAMMLVVFSYLGWDRVGYSAGEMTDPRRVIPRSLFIGIGMVVGVYVLTNFLYHYVLGMEGVRASRVVASDTAVHLLGPVGAGIIALVVMVSATGSTNGTMMTAPRVYYAMARDGLFFRWLSAVHPRFRTPSNAIIAHCVWAAVILLARSSFETIVAGMTFVVLIFYALITVALFKFRRNHMGEPGGYRVPLYPLLPAIYLAGIVALIGIRLVFEWEKSLIDLAFVLTGVPFALVWCREDSRNE